MNAIRDANPSHCRTAKDLENINCDSAEKRSLVVTLNPSFPQDKLREGSQVRENMRFFALLRMTNRFDGGVFQQNQLMPPVLYALLCRNQVISTTGFEPRGRPKGRATA